MICSDLVQNERKPRSASLLCTIGTLALFCVHLCTLNVFHISSLSTYTVFERKTLPTCAIVLNSAILNFHEYGADIDEHEIVVRFNLAPTKGFERIVGSRTTYIWTWHAYYQRFLSQMETPEYNDTKIIIGPFHWDADLLNKSGIPFTRYVIPNATELGEACKTRWLTEEFAAEFPNKRCTSGVSATIYFLERCSIVDVYGLYDGDLCDIPYRYFQPRKCNASEPFKIDPSHNFTHEHEMFRFYSQEDSRLRLHPPYKNSTLVQH